MLLTQILIRLFSLLSLFGEPETSCIIKPVGEELEYTCRLSPLRGRELMICSRDTCTLHVRKENKTLQLLCHVASQGDPKRLIAFLPDTDAAYLKIRASKGSVCFFFVSTDGKRYVHVGEEFNAGGSLRIKIK